MDDQDWHMALMKEAHHLTLCPVPCCDNQQLLRMLPEQTLNEGLRIPIEDRRLHGETCGGTQLFGSICEEISLLHLPACWRPKLRLLYCVYAYLLCKKRWWKSNQQDSASGVACSRTRSLGAVPSRVTIMVW